MVIRQCGSHIRLQKHILKQARLSVDKFIKNV
ncbi:hypothetical protein LR003_03485 [candidate division NPL-UPA2 bacterium]|nr:hypothetical protein [candidate division NPL-UPA2 bacterium]